VKAEVDACDVVVAVAVGGGGGKSGVEVPRTALHPPQAVLVVPLIVPCSGEVRRRVRLCVVIVAMRSC
jgi:hypothetical protein